MFIHLGYHEERVLGEGRKRGVEEIYTVKICLMRMISNRNYNRGESGLQATTQGDLAGKPRWLVFSLQTPGTLCLWNPIFLTESVLDHPPRRGEITFFAPFILLPASPKASKPFSVFPN